MYTRKEAQNKMQEYIDFQNDIYLLNFGEDPDIIIYEELTQEWGFGWIFFWQVKNVKEDYSNVIAGNGPVIVEKETLDMYKMGTAMESEKYIDLYLKDKNALAKLEKDKDGTWDVVNID